MSRISGMNFRFTLGDMKIKAQKFTADITDNSAVVFTAGIPDGYVDGSVECSGEMELNTADFNLLVKQAQTAGSFRALETFDALAYAKVGDQEMKVELFGVKIKLSSLLDVDTAGGSALVHKVPFDVTSPDFIKLNGVPYLRPEEVENF